MKNTKVTAPSVWSIFIIFLKLGLTSFGGPVAHLGYFRHEFVEQRQWLSERSYADLVALCQFLPGPASSQVGIALGFFQGGYKGALAAWLGFTLPSALALMLFAIGVTQYGNILSADVLHGLKLTAVAIVAQAVWGMAKNLCTDRQKISIAILSACVILLFPSVWMPLVVIFICGVIGFTMQTTKENQQDTPLTFPFTPPNGLFWLSLFVILLLGLPFLAGIFPHTSFQLVDTFYRAGSLVFGGGHVVLPLLQAEITPNLLSHDLFLAGYGATQAVPGPLFTFSAFLGTAIQGSLGGFIALIAIFIPSFLLIFAALPFWQRLHQQRKTQSALALINAAVVGILLAALYQPVWTSAVNSAKDFVFVLIAFAALMFWKMPPWLVVIACGLAGGLFLT